MKSTGYGQRGAGPYGGWSSCEEYGTLESNIGIVLSYTLAVCLPRSFIRTDTISK